MSGTDPFVILARIGAPHGVRGAVRMKVFAESSDSLTAYGPLERTKDGGTLSISSLRPGKTPDMIVATLDGVTTREAAESLNGVELGLPRSVLPAPDDEDVFYHTDLIGLEARLLDGTPDGTRFGEVLQVANYGADDLLDVKPDRGGPSLLVPFTKEIVPDVKVAEGYVTIDPPEGLLDPPSAKPDDEADDV